MRPQLALACLTALLLAPLVPGGAAADPTAPVTVTLPDDLLGEMHIPGVRLVADLDQPYVEEEYLISGAATVYNYDSDPPVRGAIIPQDVDVPYTTRIIIRRPTEASAFNGTVVIEWWNSTSLMDLAPVWDASAEYFARTGIVYVGVTNATETIGFLVGSCAYAGLLPPTCGTRYAALSMLDNGQAYEMVSQIANLLKGDAENNPLPEEFDVELLFHAGQSQQGGSIITYASAFHFPVNDGYFIQAGLNARRINDGPVCGQAGSDPYPDCTPALTGEQRLVRTDLPVPVYRAQTETDMSWVISDDSRQADTDTFRYYEMAGTAHITVHKDIEIVPGESIEDWCIYPFNTLADGPVFGSYLYNAMWRNMEWQASYGWPAPHGDLIEVENGEIKRNLVGNALGGIRLPQLDVQIAVYKPNNEVDPNIYPTNPLLKQMADLYCRLSGRTTDFPQAWLDSLYPNHASYVNPFTARANQLVWDGFLLQEDSQALKEAAALSTIGCGIGVELALLLPPLMWLHRRRQRGSS